jgi:hypothetical protein
MARTLCKCFYAVRYTRWRYRDDGIGLMAIMENPLLLPNGLRVRHQVKVSEDHYKQPQHNRDLLGSRPNEQDPTEHCIERGPHQHSDCARHYPSPSTGYGWRFGQLICRRYNAQGGWRSAGHAPGHAIPKITNEAIDSQPEEGQH